MSDFRNFNYGVKLLNLGFWPSRTRTPPRVGGCLRNDLDLDLGTHFSPGLKPYVLGPKCWKFSKITKNKFFQTCPGIIPTEVISCACWELCNTRKSCFSYCFRSLTSHPIPQLRPGYQKMMKNFKKKTRKYIFSNLSGKHFCTPGAFCELATSKKMFFTWEYLPPSHRIWNRGP